MPAGFVCTKVSRVVLRVHGHKHSACRLLLWLELRNAQQKLRCSKPDQVGMARASRPKRTWRLLEVLTGDFQGKLPELRLDCEDGPFCADRWRIDGSPAARVETLKGVYYFEFGPRASIDATFGIATVTKQGSWL